MTIDRETHTEIAIFKSIDINACGYCDAAGYL